MPMMTDDDCVRPETVPERPHSIFRRRFKIWVHFSFTTRVVRKSRREGLKILIFFFIAMCVCVCVCTLCTGYTNSTTNPANLRGTIVLYSVFYSLAPPRARTRSDRQTADAHEIIIVITVFLFFFYYYSLPAVMPPTPSARRRDPRRRTGTYLLRRAYHVTTFRGYTEVSEASPSSGREPAATGVARGCRARLVPDGKPSYPRIRYSRFPKDFTQ